MFASTEASPDTAMWDPQAGFLSELRDKVGS